MNKSIFFHIFLFSSFISQILVPISRYCYNSIYRTINHIYYQWVIKYFTIFTRLLFCSFLSLCFVSGHLTRTSGSTHASGHAQVLGEIKFKQYFELNYFEKKNHELKWVLSFFKNRFQPQDWKPPHGKSNFFLSSI